MTPQFNSSPAAELPRSVIDIDIESGIRKLDDSLDALIKTVPTFQYQLICVNPDALNEAAVPGKSRGCFDGRVGGGQGGGCGLKRHAVVHRVCARLNRTTPVVLLRLAV